MDRLKALFNKHDHHKVGLLSAAEFAKIMNSVTDLKLSDNKAQKIINFASQRPVQTTETFLFS